MVQIEVLEAQQRLPELLNAVEAGEEIEIRTQNGRTYRLAPSRPRPPVTGVPKAGSCQGLFVVPADFKALARRTTRVHGMILLLDTCALLWFLSKDPQLSAAAKTAIEDPANVRWASPISLLEIALKVRIGKLPSRRPFGALFPAELVANDIHLLPIDPRHIEPLTTLTFHHNDPFDRAHRGDIAGREADARFRRCNSGRVRRDPIMVRRTIR